MIHYSILFNILESLQLQTVPYRRDLHLLCRYLVLHYTYIFLVKVEVFNIFAFVKTPFYVLWLRPDDGCPFVAETSSLILNAYPYMFRLTIGAFSAFNEATGVCHLELQQFRLFDHYTLQPNVYFMNVRHHILQPGLVLPFQTFYCSNSKSQKPPVW